MKIAHILPRGSRHFQQTFHLILGQRLKEQDYLDYCFEASKRQAFLMVDNGAAEMYKIIMTPDGDQIAEPDPDYTPASFEDIVRLADQLHADEIILPDKKLDRKTTWELSFKYADLVQSWRRAVVPQGQNSTEWKDSALELLELRPITVCITKDYELWPGGRSRLVQWLRNVAEFHGNIHMLGLKLGDPIAELKYLRVRCGAEVRSVDTGAAAAWAQCGLRFSECKKHVSLNWDQPVVNRDTLMQNARELNDAAWGGA